MKTLKVLVIRFRRVGDAVISSTLCSSIRRSVPNAEIHYVLNENIAPLFEHHPAIDKLITFSDTDLSSFSKYRKKVKQIMKATDYDIIIDTRSTIKTIWFSLYSMKTKYRIGKKKIYNHFIHNYRIDNEYKGDDRDNVELTLDLLNPLIKEYNIGKDPNFRLFFTKEEVDTFHNYMITQGITFSKPVIICAVTARLEHKIWPMDKSKEILQRILAKYDVQLIFNYGGDKEKDFALKLHKEMDNDSRIFTNIEAKTLRELVAMFANSDFFFGNEGGPRHISQALKISSFAIYPPGINKKNWLPGHSDLYLGIELKDINNEKALDKHLSYKEKFDLIDVESVWNNLDKMLSQHLKPKDLH